MLKEKMPVLMYHEVFKDKDSLGKNMHSSGRIQAEVFESQIAYLSENNFYTSCLEDIFQLKELHDGGMKKPVIITFDDGHIGNYKYAFPILKKYNFSATFFVATSLIGKENMMTWDYLREMHDAGMEIQSHTVTHRPLSSLSDQQIRFELTESKRIIEDKLKNEVSYLSLPHGDFDKRTDSIAKNSGYKAIFTSVPEYLDINKNFCKIGRIDIRSNYSFEYFRGLITSYRKLQFLNVQYKIKNKLKKIISVNNYRKIYRLLNGIKLNQNHNL